MKTVSFILIFLFLFSCIGLSAGEKTGQGERYSWDFGKVKKGEVLRHVFLLKNNSDRTMRIKDITTSCGCAVSKTRKTVLAPQETTDIEVSFDTSDYSGDTRQFIYVHSDSLDTSASLGINSERNRTIDNPIIRFIIKAYVIN